MSMKDVKEIIWVGVAAIGTILFTAAFSFLWAFPLMWAWNYTIPYIFGLPVVGYWHMFCLYIILSSLWKSSHTHSK